MLISFPLGRNNKKKKTKLKNKLKEIEKIKKKFLFNSLKDFKLALGLYSLIINNLH